MNLLSYVRIHVLMVLVIHTICIACNPQYGYSAFNNKVNNQRRRSNVPTKHPNAHFSRLVSNDFTHRNPRKQNIKDQGRTFGTNHQSGGPAGFPHSIHNHHRIHQGIHGFNQPSYQYQQNTQYPQSAQTANPCYYRSNGKNVGKRDNNKESARFLWDLNVFNVYHGNRPQRSGCDDELYSDPDNAAPQAQTSRPGVFSNFVSLFSHGGALNPYSGRPANRPVRPYRPSYQPPQSPARPIGGSDIGSTGSSGDINSGSNGDSGDIYDPVFENNNNINNNNNNNNDRPVYENQYADQYNEGPSLSPGQIVGGIAHTVNGVIQQLSGNGPSRSASFLRRYYNENMRRRQYYNDNYY